MPEDEDDDGGAFMIQSNKAYDLFVCAKKAFDKYCMMLFLHILDSTVPDIVCVALDTRQRQYFPTMAVHRVM